MLYNFGAEAFYRNLISMLYCTLHNFMTGLADIDMTKIKGVLIDFDNTLYEYAPCHEAGLKAAYEVYNSIHTIAFEYFLDMYKTAQREVKMTTNSQAASHSRLLYFQKMVENSNKATQIPLIFKLEDAYWDSFTSRIELRKNVIQFMENCRQNGLKICLITDLTASVQFRKIMATGVDSFVDFVVTSEEAGAEKPNNVIFSLALSKLGLVPNEVVMIGDDKLKDIDGAQKLGIKAYLV